MTVGSSILFSESKKVVKYNSKDDNFEWVIEFSHKIYGLSRVDNYVFVTTYSNWGKSFSHIVVLKMENYFGKLRIYFILFILLEIL